ncbi:hypothetical protein K461DRAFT_294905 [Myriangium duriaei CBS 260.36]|uniref:RlpA-like protein double-psi beta-barrel domain-containing protein n=1 Tax=Myriangium duriaei CBS 260.36 TaxID=1168546 RepID=A0A9P4IZY9_9PEZI|nr:hypothetical protein K461DRAFT_294905 [Myriangium duriaei CBS 260.36]
MSETERTTAAGITQVPEWEHEQAGNFTAANEKSRVQHAIELVTENDAVVSTKRRLRPRFDAILPPNKRYLGLRRKWFVTGIVCAFVAVLVLVIGLAAGLSGHHAGQNLPLPSNAKTYTGDLTYYEPGLGACGVTSTSSQNIVAVSHLLWDAVQKGSDPNSNTLCGKKLRATRYNDAESAQRSVDLTVVDRCVGCAATDIDVSLSAFTQMAPEVDGRVTVTWAWL